MLLSLVVDGKSEACLNLWISLYYSSSFFLGFWSWFRSACKKLALNQFSLVFYFLNLDSWIHLDFHMLGFWLRNWGFRVSWFWYKWTPLSVNSAPKWDWVRNLNHVAVLGTGIRIIQYVPSRNWNRNQNELLLIGTGTGTCRFRTEPDPFASLVQVR